MTRIYLALAAVAVIALAIFLVFRQGVSHGTAITEARYAAAAAKSLADNTKKQTTAENAHVTESTDIVAFNSSHPVTARQLCQRPRPAEVPPPTESMLVPAPAPLMFSRCGRQITDEPTIETDCLDFLNNGPTKSAPN